MNEETPTALRRLGDAEREALTEAERDAVRRAVAAAGPGIVRRARAERRVAATVIVLAAAAAILLAWRALGPQAPLATHTPASPPSHGTAVATARDAHAGTLAPRRCESFVARPPATTTDSAGRTRYDLGSVALAVLGAGGDGRLTAAERCDTAFALTRGSLDVHARDLGEGRLRVATPRGDVTVHGTVFRVVVADGDAVVVGVVEGVVTVERDGIVIARVTAGESVRIDGTTAAPVPLDAEDAESVRVALGLLAPTASNPTPRGTTAPAPTTEVLLDRALDASRSGNLDAARSFYRQAGAGSGGDAESAWLLLARLELRANRPAAARAAIAERARRFPNGALGPDAGWIDVQAAQAAGDRVAALAAARALVARYPGTPQAIRARTEFSMQAP